MLGDGWSQALDPSEAASAEYSSDISPVILAAQLNQFEILQMLIRKDASIEKPHRYFLKYKQIWGRNTNPNISDIPAFAKHAIVSV